MKGRVGCHSEWWLIDEKVSFFLLHAAKVRSSCEEGPGQNALQTAYHDPHLDDWIEAKQNNVVIQAKNCKQTN